MSDPMARAQQVEALQELIASPGWALVVQQAQALFGGHTIVQTAERLRLQPDYAHVGMEIAKAVERCAAVKALVEWPAQRMRDLERTLVPEATATEFAPRRRADA